MCTNESFVVYIFILCPIVSIADSDLSELWFYILCSIVSIADSDLSELWLYILLSCSIVVLYIVSYCVYRRFRFIGIVVIFCFVSCCGYIFCFVTCCGFIFCFCVYRRFRFIGIVVPGFIY